MDPRSTAKLYYDAWRAKAGDMTGVPLADDFTFTGPVASFESAAGFREMAKQAGAAVRSFTVRHQFSEGDLVCSVIDWEMAMLTGVLTAAEVLEVRNGTIVRGELIYDAENLRKVMAGPPIAELLDVGLREVIAVFGRVDRAGWAAPSPCTGWTVRQAGNHLVGSVGLLTRIVTGEPVAPAELDPQRHADTDHLGTDPEWSLRELAKRTVAAFSNQEILDRHFDLPVPDAPGQLIGTLGLLETLVHGWDVATGAGVAYRPDDAVVAAVQAFATVAIGDDLRARGLFGPAVATGQDAGPLAAILGHLGRSAG